VIDLAALQFVLAPALALTLLHSLWQVAAIAAAAWAVLAACAQRSARLRHALAMGFLVAMAAVPALTFLRLLARPEATFKAQLLPMMTPPLPIAAIPGAYASESTWLPGVLSLLWLAGAALMLLRHFGGWRLVSALDRQAYARLPSDWQQRVDTLHRALGITRKVTVRVAADIAAPFTARLLRPVIWLPQKLLESLPTAQLEALLAHELAHIARLDWLWNGLQCVVESLLFFHPGAWWLGRRIRQEREHACDDLAVVACGGDSLPLAEALASLACDRQPYPRLVLAAQGGSLMQRITRLLTGGPRAARWRWPLAAAVVLASGTLLATQTELGKAALPNLHISTTTDGALKPGDVREISATGFDHDRYYKGSMDARGRLVEIYREDGVDKPIDAGVRAWIAQMSTVPPPPPPPPAPPPPPPAPPAPPPPELSELPAVQELIRLVAADGSVAGRTGSPAQLVGNAIDGSVSLSDGNGEADLEFTLAGPSGRVDVEVAADRDHGRWTIATLEVAPATR
jgi:beta-lactamase regulating signal transducer with metallopeptidase domain